MKFADEIDSELRDKVIRQVWRFTSATQKRWMNDEHNTFGAVNEQCMRKSRCDILCVMSERQARKLCKGCLKVHRWIQRGVRLEQQQYRELVKLMVAVEELRKVRLCGPKKCGIK